MAYKKSHQRVAVDDYQDTPGRGIGISTIVGMLMGIGILASAICLGNVPIQHLCSLEALLVVFGGTLTALITSFSPGTLKDAVFACFSGFSANVDELREDILTLADISAFVRSNGKLALQPMLSEFDHPLMRKGLVLLVDNRPEAYIRQTLETEIEVNYRHGLECARVLEAAGGFSPTMGIIGAVMGLIHVIGSFQDPVQLGQGVAKAFSATLYGVAFSNFFLLPLAEKVRNQAKTRWLEENIILDGILAIHQGEHPMLMQEKLYAYLPQQAKPQHDGMFMDELVITRNGWQMEGQAIQQITSPVPDKQGISGMSGIDPTANAARPAPLNRHPGVYQGSQQPIRPESKR